MNKIRPLIISRTLPYLGGREVMVDEIIKYFSKNGAVWVLTPDKYKGSKGIHIINQLNPDKNIIEALRKNGVNIVNCHTFYLFDAASRIAERLDVPLVFTLHGVFIGIYGGKYDDVIGKLSKKSSLVVTVSKTYLKKLKETFPAEVDKFVKIQNGIKSSKRAFPMKNASQIKYIVVPARLNKLKGLEYVAKAANQMKDVRFCICHPSGRMNNVQENKYKNKLVKKSGNLLHFKMLDHEDMLSEMRKADLILLPSLIEGISIAILEAMSLGKIVAATKVGGNPEIIKDGVSGFLFEPKSGDAIMKTVARISEIDQTKRKMISRNATSTVRGKFDINIMLRKYKEIFNYLISDENK